VERAFFFRGESGEFGLLVGNGTFFAGGLAEKIDGDAGDGNGKHESHNGKNGDAKDEAEADGEKRQKSSNYKMVGFIVKAVAIKHDDTSRCMDFWNSPESFVALKH
jgi:hypothetical protein